MKSSYLRAGLALLCAVILSACGGNNGSLALQGSIGYDGPPQAGLVLVNKGNGERLAIDTGASSFVFTKLLGSDEQFDVEVETNPTATVCTPSANTGKASVYTVYSVVISCRSNTNVLGGTVTGLKGTGLVVANGADTVPVQPSATTPGANVSFTFPTKVATAALYGGSILTQPAGQTCTFTSTLNPGTMPDANQLGLIVNCVDN